MTARQLVAGAADDVGLVVARVARSTGTAVALYRPGSQLDPDEGWLTLCLTHGQFVSHDTRWQATFHLPYPAGWCEMCMGNDPYDDDADPEDQ